jgi:hypothetical protein
MSHRPRRNPRRLRRTPQKNSDIVFLATESQKRWQYHFDRVLTIRLLLCGIFPVPQFHNRLEIGLPGGDGKISDALRTIAVWGRNLNFQKEKNRP